MKLLYREKGTILLLINIILLSASCGKNYSPEEQEYVSEIKKFRIEKDEYMKNDPDSPFNGSRKVEFKPLNYYEPDPDYKYKSRLYHYKEKDTIIILGTKGEERKVIRYGYVVVKLNDKEQRINVYQGFTEPGEEYFSIWFTDKTTGGDTYGVGRYLDFELNSDEGFLYTIDFNLAYNPYCAYSPEYSCAVPAKEDHIPAAIEAGEKNFH